MGQPATPHPFCRFGGALRRLAHDRAGNTLALVAAGIIPILAMVGSGVDMGRSYLSQSRLQQACDAGVLAARKRLGTTAAIGETIPVDAAEIGQRFFNINFRSGSYGTQERDFVMTMEEDFAISAVATVKVPTTVMSAFGYDEVPIEVECQAQLNVSNTDVMMVLDVTGSMSLTNPGDTVSRMDAMKATVRGFHAQLAAAASPATRIRFGFVPYSSNVNVGSLLLDDWVVDEWQYQSRERVKTGTVETTKTYDRNWSTVSGTKGEAVTQLTYAATWHSNGGGGGGVDGGVDGGDGGGGGGGGGGGWYGCDSPAPMNTYVRSEVLLSSATEPFAGPPVGTRRIEYQRSTQDGTQYWLQLDGQTCLVKQRAHNNFIQTFDRVTDPVYQDTFKWHYRQLSFDVTNWRTSSPGCIEERDTYEIGDYASVDLEKALDLDIDLVPTDEDETKWRPMYPDIIYARAKTWDNTGTFSKSPKTTTDEYVNPSLIGLASCPPSARKLSTMTADELNTYLATLYPTGQTYHDIGMIWGGRLISPTGLFAGENVDVSVTNPTTRHLIFLTDGETAPLDLAYSSYGLEPVDGRRWDEQSSLTLQQTVESRFAFACDEVKKKNVTVWVVAFGTALNPMFQECAGDGRYFEASDADELSATFATIARQMGELRINR